MAKVTLIPEKTKTIVKVVEPKKIVLELSEEEAIFLVTLCGKVTGSDNSTPRKHASTIFDELYYKSKIQYRLPDPSDVRIDLSKYNLDWKRKC